MAGKVETLVGSPHDVLRCPGRSSTGSRGDFVATVRARQRGGPLAIRIDAFFLRVPLVSSFLIQREGLLNFAFAVERHRVGGEHRGGSVRGG